tara:strand:- start:1671 stop:1895 length:225 start_codon:yes stop_codon:yes gene_type:complete
MYNNATFVDKEQLKNLKKIDSWLIDNMYSLGEEVVTEARELISRIEKKGHYYESEAEVLNMIANEYNQWKKQNK